MLVRNRELAGPRLMLLAIHIPLIWEAPIYTLFGALGGVPPAGYPWLAMPAAAMIFGLQLRHSFAMAHGRRPRGGTWTLLALAVLAYVPMHWLGIDWITEQTVLIASVPMVLSGWLATFALTGPCVYLAIELARVFPAHPGPAIPADYLNWVTYYLVGISISVAALYASARLVKTARELRDTRVALAEAAVGRERLRVSRDVHDLLGYSLAAISLKGDLAVRLLRRDGPAALTEIENLTGVARDALTGLRAVTRDGNTVTLERELENARALLAAAGVTLSVHGDLPGLPAAVDEVLAWTIREGTANIIRHTTATAATITLERRDGDTALEIRNDGAPAVTDNGGSGLTGLAARMEELSGTLSYQPLSDGRFRLTAQIPATSSKESSWSASASSSPKTST